MKHDQDDDFTKQVFNSARGPILDPPAHSAHHISSIYVNHLQLQKRVNLWQWFGLLATTACVLLVFSLNRQQKKDFYFEANTNQPYVVRLLAGELQEGLITQARITLPNGVNIHSKQFPELNDQQQVTLNWESGLKVEHFPLVIVGNTEGEKELTVQFLDSSGNVLVERQVLVKFIRSKENV